MWPNQDRARLEAVLAQHLAPPLQVELVEAAWRAVELVRVDAADCLVEIEAGPALPAGTLVEMLGLWLFVENY